MPLFEGLVDFLGQRLGYAYVFIGQLSPNDPAQVDTVAVHAHGKLAGNISYRLPGRHGTIKTSLVDCRRQTDMRGLATS